VLVGVVAQPYRFTLVLLSSNVFQSSCGNQYVSLILFNSVNGAVFRFCSFIIKFAGLSFKSGIMGSIILISDSVALAHIRSFLILDTIWVTCVRTFCASLPFNFHNHFSILPDTTPTGLLSKEFIYDSSVLALLYAVFTLLSLIKFSHSIFLACAIAVVSAFCTAHFILPAFMKSEIVFTYCADISSGSHLHTHTRFFASSLFF